MSGEHQHISARQARAGEKSGRVRNVLVISTALAVLALGTIVALWIA
jgi:hypothetical protein